MDVAGVPPGNCQLKEAAFVEEVLVYCTLKGAQPFELDAVNPAVGGVTTTTVWVAVVDPQALVAVNTIAPVAPVFPVATVLRQRYVADRALDRDLDQRADRRHVGQAEPRPADHAIAEVEQPQPAQLHPETAEQQAPAEQQPPPA